VSKIFHLNDGEDFLNVLTVDGIEAEAEFEAIVFGWVVTGGDHDAAVGLQVLDGKV